jgi:uncharacterized membrane protein (TIGR02234 family)
MTTSDGDSVAQVRRAGRRELAFLLLLGAAGAGLVLLAARQGWAHVETTEPRPLPDNVAAVTGQTLVPVTGALALAALAGLAAVLATRRTLRRIAGVVLAGFGVGIAVAVSAGISAAAVRAAAAASTGAPVGSGVTGSDIGSTTGGGQGQAAGTGVSGFPSHVVFAAFPWRGVAFAGALAIIAAGVLVTWRALELPVMSSRYDAPASASAASVSASASAASVPASASKASAPGPAVPAGDRGNRRPDSAAIWESLSRGEDPTGSA